MFPLLKLRAATFDTLAYHLRYPDAVPEENPQTRMMEFIMRSTMVYRVTTQKELEELLFRFIYLFPEVELPFNYDHFELYFSFNGFNFFKPLDIIAHMGICLHERQLISRQQFLAPMREPLRNNAIANAISNNFLPNFDFIDMQSTEEQWTWMGIKKLPEPEIEDIRLMEKQARFLTKEIFTLIQKTIYGYI